MEDQYGGEEGGNESRNDGVVSPLHNPHGHTTYPDPSESALFGAYGPFPDAAFTQNLQPIPDNLPKTPSTSYTQIQALAEQFHIRHGDPGAGQSPVEARSLPPEARSELDGVYIEDTGGKAAAKAAWRARATYGDTFTYDPEYNPYLVGGDDIDAMVERVMAEDSDAVPEAYPEAREPVRKTRRGGWRRLLKDTEHANVGLADKARGVSRGRPRGRRARGSGIARNAGPRTRKRHQDDPQFKHLMKQATAARLDNKLEEALNYCRQAIQINPEVYQAHALLVDILESAGRENDAVVALEVAANTSRDPQFHIRAAEKIIDLAGVNRTPDVLRRAVSCYSEALKLTWHFRTNRDYELKIRGNKFELNKELKDVKCSRMDVRAIVRGWPFETYYLKEWATLCAQWQDTSEIKEVKEAYEAAFEHFADQDRFGAEDDDTDQWSHLNIYLELVDMAGTLQPGMGLESGLAMGKRLARWFLGRQDETVWEQYRLDDREFDDDDDRRNEVPEFQQGDLSQDPNEYGWGLPIDIRVKFGLLRLNMGVQCHDEAMRHFSVLRQHDDEPDEYFDMFLQVGKALYRANHRVEALKHFDIVREAEMADDRDDGLEDKLWMQMADCYGRSGRHDDAIACYEVVRGHKRASQDYTISCARLCKYYEDSDKYDEARALCNELILYNRRDLLVTAGVKMLPPPTERDILRPYRFDLDRPRVPIRPIKPVVPLKEIRPNGGPGPVPSSIPAGPINGGPLSRSVDLPPAPTELSPPTRRKRKRGRKNRLRPELDDSDDEVDENGEVKRPRLRKSYNKKAIARRAARYALIQDAEARCLASFEVVKEQWPALKIADDEDAIEQWIDAANTMVKDFTSMKIFYPERDKTLRVTTTDDPSRPFRRAQQQRYEDVAGPESYLSIPFTHWHHVFSDLALLYARNGEQDRCYQIIKDVIFGANVFYLHPDLKRASFGVAYHCAFAFNDNEYSIQLTRELISDNDFRGGQLFQLLAAVSRFSYGSNWFNAGPSQKFMLRMVKMKDFMLMAPHIRNRLDFSIQKSALETRAVRYKDEEHKLDAGVLMMYGHMVAIANHSHSAIPYYYRALALEPDNICINLSIATMWVQISMKRQTDNRQFGINQGLSFLYRYYALRTASGKVSHLQEAEYNVARMWHYLGLTHLAVPGYEKVLALSGGVQDEARELRERGEMAIDHEAEDLAREAAFALQNVYELAGNYDAAMAITEEWLVI